MGDLAAFVDGLAQESGFSGAVRVDRAGETLVERAYGFANRAYRVPNAALDSKAVVTNKTVNAPYRGAGRPEAVWAMERALDRLARQMGIDPIELEGWDFGNFLIQPMDCEDVRASYDASIALAMDRPKWRLTLQAHKVVGLK